MRLVLYNIGYGMGFSGRIFEYIKFWQLFSAKNKEKIAEFLKKQKPDIVGIDEIDLGSIRGEQAYYFKKILGFKSSAANVKYNNFLNKLPILRKQGNAILAKEKFGSIKYKWFSIGAKRLVIIAETKKIVFVLVHLALNTGIREQQLKDLAGIVGKIKKLLILMGDFNTKDNEIKDFVKLTGLRSAGKAKTFPSFAPKKQLDYILVSKKIKVKKFKAVRTDFSDHLPLILDFSL